MKYMTKPVVVEAVQWRGSNVEQMEGLLSFLPQPGASVYINTTDGTTELHLGDYLIRGADGELFTCNSWVFNLIYDRIDPDGDHPP